MTKEIAQGKTLFTNYVVHAITGEVTGSETRAETEVSGTVSGGGGFTVGGTGGSAPVRGSVESKTTRFQNIYLTDEGGKEHAIELVNFLVPCREGHKLTLLRLQTGSRMGPYIHAFNHNTREHVENGDGASKAMFPKVILLAAVAVLAFVIFQSASSDPGFDGFEALAVTLIGTSLGGLVLYAIAKIIGMMKAGRVRGNGDYKRYLASLSAAS